MNYTSYEYRLNVDTTSADSESDSSDKNKITSKDLPVADDGYPMYPGYLKGEYCNCQVCCVRRAARGEGYRPDLLHNFKWSDGPSD